MCRLFRPVLWAMKFRTSRRGLSLEPQPTPRGTLVRRGARMCWPDRGRGNARPMAADTGIRNDHFLIVMVSLLL